MKTCYFSESLFSELRKCRNSHFEIFKNKKCLMKLNVLLLSLLFLQKKIPNVRNGSLHETVK